jgi:hypothetical protein
LPDRLNEGEKNAIEDGVNPAAWIRRRWRSTRRSPRMLGWPFWLGVGLSLTPLIYYWFLRISLVLMT